MPSSTYSRKRARSRVRYDGRSYAGTLRGDAKPKAPSKRLQAADEALTAILELFDSGDLPARVAETVIAR